MMLSRHCEEFYSHPGKTLKDHLEKVGKAISVSVGGLSLTFPFEKDLFRDAALLTGLYHDIGKATTFFQEYLKEENPDKKAKLKNQRETNHSLLSAVATYFAINELIYKRAKNEPDDLLEFLPIASFLVVRRHHTNLESAPDDLRLDNAEILREQINDLCEKHLDFLPYWDVVCGKLQSLPESWLPRKISLRKWLKKDRGSFPYLLINLLYSLLLDADKHEAAIGGRGLERVEIPLDLVEKYRVYRDFDKPNSLIDNMRSDIYASVLAKAGTVDIEQDRIFSFTAPTGSGKTLTALDFALKLRKRLQKERNLMPRIIYALPFLSIIDQNARVIKDVFQVASGGEPPANQVLIHHHLSDYSYRTQDNEYDPGAGEILVEGWDSEIVITTFAQFFHTLFGNRNRAMRKFNKIAGSIVILDEVQTFPHKFWLLFRETAESIAQYFNTVFILMTATQPAIFEHSIELLEDNDRFFEAFTRTQIQLKTKPPMELSAFSQAILQRLQENPKNTLIVLNTIRSAEIVYRVLSKQLRDMGFETYFLSSYVVPKERLDRISRIRNSPHLKVVISTQLIEAGVDIDMDWVVRDIGPLDSINQVAGRANRNQKEQIADVEVVTLRDNNGRNFYTYIYDPFLMDKTQGVLSGRSLIPETDFLELNTRYFQEIKRGMSDDESKKFLKAVYDLNYEEVGRFQLIEKEYEKADMFVELDEEASTVWNEFSAMRDIKDFFERRRAFNCLKGDFYQYVISVSTKRAAENMPPELGGIRFVGQDQLEEFYDLETGFKVGESLSLW